jgi:hypothetical protein
MLSYKGLIVQWVPNLSLWTINLSLIISLLSISLKENGCLVSVLYTILHSIMLFDILTLSPSTDIKFISFKVSSILTKSSTKDSCKIKESNFSNALFDNLPVPLYSFIMSFINTGLLL